MLLLTILFLIILKIILKLCVSVHAHVQISLLCDDNFDSVGFCGVQEVPV